MYGPRQRRDMFLPRLIDRVRAGESIRIDTEGGIRVNPIFVDDVARLLAQLVAVPTPAVMNVGGPDVVSIQEIANSIGELVSNRPIFELGPASGDVVADVSVMEKYLPSSQMVPFKNGLALVVKSYFKSI